MDYNTQRDHLIMPEYGRHIQKMIAQVKQIEDRDKRNEQIRAVVNSMIILNPHLRDFPDYRHKLWDHVYAIADYELDIDSPYPAPEKEEINSKPEPMALERNAIKARCYGRNIQNMVDLVASREEGETKNEMIRTLALYMRQQYLIWNKDSVADETIFKDMELLSEGRLKVPEGISLGVVSGDFSRPGMGQPKGNFKKNKNQKKRKRV